MLKNIDPNLNKHLVFNYSIFDRVVLRGYLIGLFFPGSVINLLRNLGFRNYSNGVLRILTDQLNSHIQKMSNKLGIDIHWWNTKDKEKYHSKIDFVKIKYNKQLLEKGKKSKVIAIIKAIEKTSTFSNKQIKTKAGKFFMKMFSVKKYVSQYYIYIDDEVLGLSYLKISSYLPFVSEFYFNGHNYIQKQFDLNGKKYKMKDNSFTYVEDLELLEYLSSNFKPSMALKRINYWMNIFFKFDKGNRSTRSKLLKHNWYTYQTEIATNLIFKSAKFANEFFRKILSNKHTIGLPDKLTEIFSVSKKRNNSKTTQTKFKTKAVIKHWLESNSIKCYNKSGCLIRVETTINKPDLPGLKLKKPAINLMAYYWYGLQTNSRYVNSISDIDLSSLSDEIFRKYKDPVMNKNGKRIAAPDLRKDQFIIFLNAILEVNSYSFGFKTKHLQRILGESWKTPKIAYELRKLRERGAVKKLQSSHYYRLTQEGYKWIFFSYFNSQHLIKPLLSTTYSKHDNNKSEQASIIDGAYKDINKSLAIIMTEFKLVA